LWKALYKYMWIELQTKPDLPGKCSLKKKWWGGNSSSAKHLCSNAALLIHCNTCSADNGMQGENNRRLYYSKITLWGRSRLGFRSREQERGFSSLLYLVERDRQNLIMFEIEIRSMQSNKTDYENRLIFSWTEPLKSLILGKQHECISALCNRFVS